MVYKTMFSRAFLCLVYVAGVTVGTTTGVTDTTTEVAGTTTGVTGTTTEVTGTTTEVVTATNSPVITPTHGGEHIILRCGPSSFQVDIPKRLIEAIDNATDLYLFGDPNDSICRGFYNGELHISLKSSLTKCGTQFIDNGTEILYKNVVMIHSGDGNNIVNFLSVEIPITCKYNNSDILRTHFETLSDVISKTATGHFEFEFMIYTDKNYTEVPTSFPVEIKLNEVLYFRAELIRSASNLKIHLRSCRATPSADFDDAVVYEFIIAGCGVNNAPVRVFIPNLPSQADFEIPSFKFTSDLSNQDSQIWVHCEVVVCDASDENSECHHGCEESRYRRSVESPPLRVHRMVLGPILLKDEDSDKSDAVIWTKSSNGIKDVFTTVLSAMSILLFVDQL